MPGAPDTPSSDTDAATGEGATTTSPTAHRHPGSRSAKVGIALGVLGCLLGLLPFIGPVFAVPLGGLALASSGWAYLAAEKTRDRAVTAAALTGIVLGLSALLIAYLWISGTFTVPI